MLSIAFSKFTREEIIRVSFGFSAFLIYACATLFSNQLAHSGNYPAFDIERTGMASAVSNIIYGAPIATVYGNSFTTFVYSKTPLNELLEQAERKEIEPGELIPYTPDGIGIGQAVFTTVAMRLFGIHPRSIIFLFLCLMGLTTLIFLARFHDERSVFILAAFLALTVMFASLWGTESYEVSQIPAGGHRYFSLLAAIPGLHILLELIDSVKNSALSKSSLRMLALQMVFFMIAYFMNLATVCLCGPLILFALYAFFATRPASPNRGILYNKILIVAGMVSSLLVGFSWLTPHAYRITGRAQPATTWHHVIIGFGENPSWPFGNLADLYKGCMPGQPDSSLYPGLADLNGVCVWAAYAKRNGMAADKEIYDKNFDIATREAVLKILWQYPAQSLITFIYYKPLAILHTLAQYFHFSIPTSWPVRISIICQIAIFLAFASFNRSCLSIRSLRPIFFGCGLTAISACGLYIVAYSTPLTSLDLFFYLLAFICTAIASITAGAVRWIGPSALSGTNSGAS
jgi:hypothetical protein